MRMWRDIGGNRTAHPQNFLPMPVVRGRRSEVYSSVMRDAATILVLESEAIPTILESIESKAFDYETVCTGWSVRDVLGHCGAALSMAAANNLHGFSPSDN